MSADERVIKIPYHCLSEGIAVTIGAYRSLAPIDALFPDLHIFLSRDRSHSYITA
jgi:hypothetical protein